MTPKEIAKLKGAEQMRAYQQYFNKGAADIAAMNKASDAEYAKRASAQAELPPGALKALTKDMEKDIGPDATAKDRTDYISTKLGQGPVDLPTGGTNITPMSNQGTDAMIKRREKLEKDYAAMKAGTYTGVLDPKAFGKVIK